MPFYEPCRRLDGDRHRGTNGGVRNDGHFMVREQQLFDVLELLDVKKKRKIIEKILGSATNLEPPRRESERNSLGFECVARKR